jgi:hypothetical protein
MSRKKDEMTKDKALAMLMDVAEAAWRGGALPEDLTAARWEKMRDDETIITWLSMVESSLGSAAELLEDQAVREAGREEDSSWRADALHVEALQCFVSMLINVKTGRTTSRRAVSFGEVLEGLDKALPAARDRYIRGGGER